MASTTDGARSRSELEGQARQLETLDRLAQRFGQSLSGALSSGATGGRDLDGALGRVAGTLTTLLGRTAGQALGSTVSGTLMNAARSLSGAALRSSFGGDLLPFAKGGIVPAGVADASRARPFARGGVVAAPTYFPLGGGLGVMGEAGQEAIMPLSRGADGRLGVRAGGSPVPNVTVNIAAQDVESFRRSEAQVAAALARAVGRGRRAL